MTGKGFPPKDQQSESMKITGQGRIDWVRELVDESSYVGFVSDLVCSDTKDLVEVNANKNDT